MAFSAESLKTRVRSGISLPAGSEYPRGKKSVLGIEILMLSVSLIWGMNFSIMKDLYKWFDPLAFVVLRFTVAVTTLYVVLKLRGVSLTVERRDIVPLTGLGFLSNTVYQIVFAIGLANTKAGNAGLLMASPPIFAYLTGLWFKREYFSRRVLTGILLSSAGVAVIVLLGTKEVALGASWKGDACILAAALLWGWYTGSSARLIMKYGALRVTYWLMLTGTLLLLPPLFPALVHQDWQVIPLRGWVSFCYSTFLSIVYCYLVWSYALQHVGISRTAIYSNVTPVIALLGGWILLGERPVMTQMSGIVLILAGVFLVRSRKPGVSLPVGKIPARN